MRAGKYDTKQNRAKDNYQFHRYGGGLLKSLIGRNRVIGEDQRIRYYHHFQTRGLR